MKGENTVHNRLLQILAFSGIALLPIPAFAITVSQPYPIVPHTTASSSQVQADFGTLYSTINGYIDASNLSSSTGIYASQIIPTSTGQATFGGTQTYTFPASVSIGGGLTTNGFVNNAPATITGNVSWGTGGSGGTLYATGNINHTGDLNTGGNANITGSVTGSRFITGASQLDYNITNPGGWNFNAPLFVTGGTLATGQVSGNSVKAAQSTTQGTYYAGSSGASQIDYNVTNAGEWTLSGPATINGFEVVLGDVAAHGKMTAMTGGTSSQVLPTLVGGTSITNGSNAHAEVVNIGGGAGTYSFTKPFDSAPICVPSSLVTGTTTTTFTTNASGSAICTGG